MTGSKELSSDSTTWKDITYDGDFGRPRGDITYDAGFRYPNDIAVDPSGNLYVADAENNQVKELASGGSVLDSDTTLKPYFSAGFFARALTLSILFRGFRCLVSI